MSAVISSLSEKSRLAALLEHFSRIEGPRDPWRVAHPLPEVPLLAVCNTIADCDDYGHIGWSRFWRGCRIWRGAGCARCMLQV